MIQVKSKVPCLYSGLNGEQTEGVLRVKSLGQSGQVLLVDGDIALEIDGLDLMRAIENALNVGE